MEAAAWRGDPDLARGGMQLITMREPSPNSISSTPPSLSSVSASMPLSSIARSMRSSARSAAAANSVSCMG